VFNLHSELMAFYEAHVRLGKTRSDELATFRDNSLTRLNTGLDKLGEKRTRTYAYPDDYKNQGGYAMKTLNQARANDYDIDVGLLFYAEDLPPSPKGARERIRDAFKETGGQFKEDPQARKNAVTIWYSSGQHLDFAIYRYADDGYGNEVIEHASGDSWIRRDPDSMKKWFDKRVTDRSPKAATGATVKDEQLRRIVRHVKYFSKSRAAWRMPGGMILTTLVDECYVPNACSDDEALARTLCAIHNRLAANGTVYSPIDGSNLTEAEKRKTEMANFASELATLIEALNVLWREDCTRAQARNAWRQLFNHDYWNAANDTTAKSLLGAASTAPAGGFAFPDHERAPSRPQGFGSKPDGFG
jgi:hypothetical protein